MGGQLVIREEQKTDKMKMATTKEIENMTKTCANKMQEVQKTQETTEHTGGSNIRYAGGGRLQEGRIASRASIW